MYILKILFNLSVFSLILAQFSSLFKTGDTNIYAFDLFILLFGIYGLFYFLYIKKSLIIPSIAVILLSFTLIAFLSLIRVLSDYSFDQLLTSFFYLVRWAMYLLSAIIIYNILHTKSSENSLFASDSHFSFSKEYIIKTFINSGIILSVLGFLQFLVFPDLSLLDSSLGWDPHKYRLFSTFLDPNFVGAYLNLSLIFIIDKYYKAQQSTEKFYVWDTIAFLILLLGIFLTFSRSAWLMLSVIVLIYGLYKSKALLITFVIVAFSAYFAVPRIQTRVSGITDPADSAQFRIISWSNALSIAKDNLLLGVGFNTFRYVQLDKGLLDYDTVEEHSSSGADSSLLFVLATTGIFGLLFYLGSYMYCLFRTKSLLVTSLIIGLLLNSLFINSLFYPQIMFLFLTIMVSWTFFDS